MCIPVHVNLHTAMHESFVNSENVFRSVLALPFAHHGEIILVECCRQLILSFPRSNLPDRDILRPDLIKLHPENIVQTSVAGGHPDLPCRVCLLSIFPLFPLYHSRPLYVSPSIGHSFHSRSSGVIIQTTCVYIPSVT